MEIGDEVVILASHPPGLCYHPIPRGTTGIITQLRESGATVAYAVGGERLVYSFHLYVLEPTKPKPLLVPEMELDEIERAEQLMVNLKA